VLPVLEPNSAEEEADLAMSERDLPDLVLAGAGAEVSGDDDQPELEQNDQLDLVEQVKPELPRSHVVEVVGSEEAKERGQQPAYTRTVSTREITFTCMVCKQTVTQQRYPGHTPLYCSDGCKGERQQEQIRERVARHREKKKAAGNTHSQGSVTSL
jgi:hypothetical protein